MMVPMNTAQDGLVIVGARQLDDLLELVRLAADRLGESEPLASALLGQRAAVYQTATMEP